MPWNYRVTKDPSGGFSIREAYYEEKEKNPHSISTRECFAYGDTYEELREDLNKMIAAFSKPPLDYQTLKEVKFGKAKKKSPNQLDLFEKEKD